MNHYTEFLKLPSEIQEEIAPIKRSIESWRTTSNELYLLIRDAESQINKIVSMHTSQADRDKAFDLAFQANMSGKAHLSNTYRNKK